MQDIRDIEVWRLAMGLAHAVYDLSAGFPRDERFGVTQQLRRSAMSVPANIAEGMGRRSDREFRRYLLIALGSLEETMTYVRFAHQRTWLENRDALQAEAQLETLRRKLIKFVGRLDSNLEKP